MKIYSLNKYSVSSSGTITLDLIKDNVGNEVVENIYIQVLSNATVSLTGALKDDETATTLSALNLGTMLSSASITSAGIYALDASGLSKLTISVNGTTDIIVKCLN